jgi:RES domain-containing protein
LTLPLSPFPIGGALLAWRLDRDIHAPGWDSGEGAWRVGGRWNSPGVRAVYCSFDAATALIEVAVHKGFDTIDLVPHILSCIEILEPASIFTVEPSAIPDPNWLVPGIPEAAQQKFGDGLLASHKLVAIPSAVSRNSWNLLFVAANAKGAYKLRSQEPYVLDKRLKQPR